MKHCETTETLRPIKLLGTGGVGLADGQNVAVREVVASVALTRAADQGGCVVMTVGVVIARIINTSINIYSRSRGKNASERSPLMKFPTGRSKFVNKVIPRQALPLGET